MPSATPLRAIAPDHLTPFAVHYFLEGHDSLAAVGGAWDGEAGQFRISDGHGVVTIDLDPRVSREDAMRSLDAMLTILTRLKWAVSL